MHKLKNFEDLVFSDDFMFGKIMGVSPTPKKDQVLSKLN